MRKLLVALIIAVICFSTTQATFPTNDSAMLCPDDLSSAVKNDLIYLNYALGLEHLEYIFYRDGLQIFSVNDSISSNFTATDYSYLELIRDHEKEHVDTLIATIEALGGTPVLACSYDFGYGDSFEEFLRIGTLLENTGVSAYLGALPFLIDRALVSAAGSITAVEARHASWLNYKTGQVPFPNAFDPAQNMTTILAAASGFITSCPESNSLCYGISRDGDSVCSGHGTCSGPNLCICDPGWFGPECNCTTVCEFCMEPNLCCNDSTKGQLCYDPNVYHCLNESTGNTVLCALEDDACGTICYNTTFYECIDGRLQPIESAFEVFEEAAMANLPLPNVEIKITEPVQYPQLHPPKRHHVSSAAQVTFHTACIIIAAVLLLL